VGDNLREWELFAILLPRLSNPRVELRLLQHTLELFTKPSLMVDFAYSKGLIDQYEDQVTQALGRVSLTHEEVSGNKSFGWEFDEAVRAAGENPQTYYKPGAKGYNLALAKDDPELEVLLHHPNDRLRQLVEARVAIKSWPLHIARVGRIMRLAAACDGLLPVPLKYCGAHTARFSGGEKINLQNLAKRGLLALIRGMIVAPPGMTLVIVDAAQIEARITAWIAGQQDQVEQWARNEDLYCVFASKVLGFKVRKARKTDPPQVAKRYKWARDAVGKVGVLGCGYGMGAKKAVDYADGAIDQETAEALVRAYRAANPQIVQFWYDIQRAFVYTAKYHKPCALPRGLRFYATDDCDVILTLPNGREIKYARVRLSQDTQGMRKNQDKAEVWNELEHKWEHIWGGTLTENVVQAMARDVLVEAMLRLEDQGHHTALHIHDELVIPVPEGSGEKVLKLAEAEMAKTPTWAPGLPLGAEGLLSKRYKKD
jgi:DNA polymerase